MTRTPWAILGPHPRKHPGATSPAGPWVPHTEGMVLCSLKVPEGQLWGEKPGSRAGWPRVHSTEGLGAVVLSPEAVTAAGLLPGFLPSLGKEPRPPLP